MSDRLFLGLVALLPVHTLYLRAEVAWKPWLVLLIAVVGLDLWEARRLPWSRRAMLGLALFLATALISWPGSSATTSFWRLWMGLVAGGLLMLVTGDRVRDLDRVLRVMFWSGAVMGLTGFVLGLVTNGVFGESAVTAFNHIAGIDRVNKPAYLGSGFVALTNWHQDPGYAALWTNVWLVLSVFAWTRGVVMAPRWVGWVVIGGLIHATVLTLSRTGWLGLVVAVAALLVSHARISKDHLRKVTALLGGGLLAGGLLVGAQVAVDPVGVGGDALTALEFRITYLVVLGAIDIGEPGVIDSDRIVDDNRLEVWAEYWGRFLESPVRGIGLGTGWAQTGFQEPHNIWLQLLAETGIIGLMGFLVLLASVAWGRGGPGPIAGSVLAVVGLAGLTQTVIFEPVLWFGLGLWLAHVLNREAERPLVTVT
ncbi:MAG: O-antigen ligase family protein [Acidimicrobiia bacterium]